MWGPCPRRLKRRRRGWWGTKPSRRARMSPGMWSPTPPRPTITWEVAGLPPTRALLISSLSRPPRRRPRRRRLPPTRRARRRRRPRRRRPWQLLRRLPWQLLRRRLGGRPVPPPGRRRWMRCSARFCLTCRRWGRWPPSWTPPVNRSRSSRSNMKTSAKCARGWTWRKVSTGISRRRHQWPPPLRLAGGARRSASLCSPRRWPMGWA
mmetsp:Transcript_7022/g.24378  ORF Transcript_7022/g.24378 Transcript_7022/m.24378 type:complete len:207 (+) Transcript_7022:261-881(+)